MVMRYDRQSIKAVKDDNGFIRDTPVLTRTGVFSYVLPGGKVRREYRPPDEVFKVDSLKAFEGIPITDEHHGRVNGENSQYLVIGSVLSAGRQDGSNLVADIVIHNTTPVMKGKKELSVGYEVEIEEKSGITEDGEHYDVIQRNIKPNHLAIVSKGRAGNARLNLDSADAVQTMEKDDVTNPNVTLSTIRLDSGIEYQAAPEVIVEMSKLKQDKADAEKAKEQAKAEADTANAKVAELEKEKEQIKQDAYQAAKARLELESVAISHKVEVKADSSDTDLKKAVIKAVRGDSLNLDGKSDDYISAAFDLAISDSKERTDSEANQRKQLTTATMKQDGQELTGRAKMLAERNKQ